MRKYFCRCVLIHPKALFSKTERMRSYRINLISHLVQYHPFLGANIFSCIITSIDPGFWWYLVTSDTKNQTTRFSKPPQNRVFRSG